MIRTWISLTSSYQVKSKSLLSVCPSFAMWHQNSRCSMDWLSLMIDCVDNKWAVSLKEINEKCIGITAHSKGALTICMENLEIPGRIQMERFIPVEIFQKKSNTFRGITFLPFLPKRPKFSVPFVWITSARLHVERKWKIYRYFVTGTSQSRSCFRCQNKIPVPLDGKFSPKFPYKW